MNSPVEEVDLGSVALPSNQDGFDSIPSRENWHREYSLSLSADSAHEANCISVINRSYLALAGAENTDGVLDLRFVRPKPEIETAIPWITISCGLGTLFTGAVLLSLWSVSVMLALAGLGLLCCSALLGYFSYKLYAKKVVFLTSNGKIPILTINTKTVDNNALQHFISSLANSIKSCQARLPRGTSQLAQEVKEHRRLKEAGTINTSQYEEAKRRIFQSFPDKK